MEREKKEATSTTGEIVAIDRPTTKDQKKKRKRWCIYTFRASTRRENERKKNARRRRKNAVPILPPSRE